MNYITSMIKYLYKIYYKLFPREMVSYWITKDAVKAKLTTADDGSYIMWMDGEKYPFPGHPRGHLLYGPLSKLKHEIKNQLFNRNFERIAVGEGIQIDLDDIYRLAEKAKYDMISLDKCTPVVREVARAIQHVKWKMIVSYIFQEDDAYRMRFQFMSEYLKKDDPIGSFDYGMEMLEHAEVTSDMKERVRLVRTVLMELWKDPHYAQYWIDFVKTLDTKKTKLSNADKYFLRAKYFKADYKDPNTLLGRASNAVLY